GCHSRSPAFSLVCPRRRTEGRPWGNWNLEKNSALHAEDSPIATGPRSSRLGDLGAIKSGNQFLPLDARKRGTNNECDMECGDLSPLSCRRPGHSGDKSPHSKRAVIVRLHLTKAEPEVTPTSNRTPATSWWPDSSDCARSRI